MSAKTPMHMQELLKKSLKQLVSLRNELRKELYEYKLSLAIRKLNKTHLIRVARRNIARVNTCIKQKIAG